MGNNKLLSIILVFFTVLGISGVAVNQPDGMPAVSLIVPAKAYSSFTIQVSVSASDDKGVSFVQLLDSNDAVLGSYDCGSRLSCAATFLLPAPSTGFTSYSFKAKVNDTLNQAVMASGQGVTYDNSLSPPCGDVNGDGSSDIPDVTMIELCKMSLPICSERMKIVADTNKDGILTEDDENLLINYILGVVYTLPSCGSSGVPVVPSIVEPPGKARILLTTFVIENSEYPQQGQLKFFYSFKNNGEEDMNAVTISASIPELGVRAPILRLDELNSGRSVSRSQYIELPGDIKPGVYYLALSISSTDARKLVYREFIVN